MIKESYIYKCDCEECGDHFEIELPYLRPEEKTKGQCETTIKNRTTKLCPKHWGHCADWFIEEWDWESYNKKHPPIKVCYDCGEVFVKRVNVPVTLEEFRNAGKFTVTNIKL